MTRHCLAALALVASVGIPAFDAPVSAQKGKPPADVPGSFTLRTPFDPDGTNALGDRATGDGLGDYVADGDGTYVILNANRELRAGLYGSRYVQLDFLEAIAGTVCTTNCFNTFVADRLLIPQPNTYQPEGPYRVVMQTNVVNASNVETPNGLMGITVGSSFYSRFFFTFKDPAGRDFHWSALFNPAEYPNTNLVVVTRTRDCAWTIEAPAGTQAGLRAWNGRGRTGTAMREDLPCPSHWTSKLPVAAPDMLRPAEAGRYVRGAGFSRPLKSTFSTSFRPRAARSSRERSERSARRVSGGPPAERSEAVLHGRSPCRAGFSRPDLPADTSTAAGDRSTRPARGRR
jgi:hypothetical protein